MKTKILLVGGFEETRYLAHSLLDKDTWFSGRKRRFESYYSEFLKV